MPSLGCHFSVGGVTASENTVTADPNRPAQARLTQVAERQISSLYFDRMFWTYGATGEAAYSISLGLSNSVFAMLTSHRRWRSRISMAASSKLRRCFRLHHMLEVGRVVE